MQKRLKKEIMPRRRNKKFTLPADKVSGFMGSKWAHYTPADEYDKGVGWIDKGIENIYGYEPTKGKRVTRELDDTYELEKTSRRGTKTKKISKKRGERFLKQTAKKATRNESEKGKARDKKKTMRIMKRKSSAYGLKKLATKRRVKRNK